MSWAALPVEPACMGKAVGEAGRPLMLCGARLYIITITLENIGYHKIGSIFKYNIGSKEVELEVVESSDASCEGCVFNNSKNYYCKDTHCIDVDRKDDIDVIYKEVKRS